MKITNIKSRKSSDYRFTVDMNCAEDVISLGQLKALVKQTNKYSYRPKRVVLKGRLGSASNPARAKYSGKYIYTVAVADAEYFDVYVYDRS